MNPCCPIGDLAPHVAPPERCDCGARLHARPDGERDWLWVDDDGHVYVDRSPAEFRADPRGWWERLKREDIAAYSTLSARAHVGMLGWTHMHRPAFLIRASAQLPPTCCGMPMRAIPAGWECRERGTIFPAVSEIRSPTGHETGHEVPHAA